MSINDRFKKIIDSQYKGNKSAFAKAIGVAPTVIENVVGVRNGKPSFDVIAKVCAIANINASWVINGEGDMLQHTESNARIIGPYVSPSLGDPGVFRIPSLPVSAQASFVESISTNVYINPLEDFRDVLLLPDEIHFKEDLTTIQVDGESMEPTIVDGAWILSRRLKDSQWGNAGGVVFVSYDEYFVMKRVKANRLFTDNYILLSSDNKDYGEMTVQLADIRAMWKAIRIISSPIL